MGRFEPAQGIESLGVRVLDRVAKIDLSGVVWMPCMTNRSRGGRSRGGSEPQLYNVMVLCG